MNSISLESNSQSAEINQKVSCDDREKIQHFVDFLLNKPKMLPDFLSILMDTISARAQQRGLTPETLINDKKSHLIQNNSLGLVI